nr:hypothetical protein [Actinomycetales bacterium]
MAPEPAARIRRPSWRDPRLGIGIVLVALSVALGTWAVAAAGRTVPVWAVSRTLTPGEELESAVVAMEVSPNLAELYISVETVPAGVADRVIEAGELIPASAVVAEIDVRTVVVTVDGDLSPLVVAGSRVDLWLSPDDGAASFPVIEDVVVRGLVESSSAFSARGASVELLLDSGQVGTVLTAMNDGGSMAVVPRTAE